MQSVQLHQSRRKSKRNIRLIDTLVTIVAVVYPLTAIPQVLEIWLYHQTSGVSFLTWSSFLILQSILLVYGIAHREKRLILMWSLWILMYALIVAGLLAFQ